MSRFPPRIPHKDINTHNFETGFDEDHVEGGLPYNNFICSCCQCLPRLPVMLETCGHLFCEFCADANYKNKRGFDVQYGVPNDEAPCPNCRVPYRKQEITTWRSFHKWTKTLFSQIVIICPEGCGFKGSPTKVDEHQIYCCPKRPIRCPLGGATLLERRCSSRTSTFPPE